MIATLPAYDREVDSLADDPGPVVRVRRVRVETMRWSDGSYEVDAAGSEEDT